MASPQKFLRGFTITAVKNGWLARVSFVMLPDQAALRAEIRRQQFPGGVPDDLPPVAGEPGSGNNMHYLTGPLAIQSVVMAFLKWEEVMACVRDTFAEAEPGAADLPTYAGPDRPHDDQDPTYFMQKLDRGFKLVETLPPPPLPAQVEEDRNPWDREDPQAQAVKGLNALMRLKPQVPRVTTYVFEALEPLLLDLGARLKLSPGV